MNPLVFNPYQFLDHFEKNDQLTVASNQPLVVTDLEEIHSHMGRRVRTSSDIVQRIVFLLSKIVNPLGKSISIEWSEGRADLTADDHTIQMRSTAAFTLVTKRTALLCRLQDLFHWMIRSGHMRLQIEAPQFINIRSIRKEEIAAISGMDSVEQPIEHVVSSRKPFGFTAQLAFSPTQCTLEHKSATAADGTYLQGWVGIKPKGEMTLSLKSTPIYHFLSCANFRHYLFYQELVVPPNQTLIIEDREMNRLFDRMENYPGRKQSSLFDQMVLPYGTTIKMTHGPSGYNWKHEDNRLEVTSKEELRIGLGRESLGTTLPILARRLIDENLPALHIAPNQELFIYGIERGDIENWVPSTDGQIIQAGIKDCLLKHSYLGYTWTFIFDGDLDYNGMILLDMAGNEHQALQLKASGGMRLELDLADADTLAYQILQEGGKPLQEAMGEFNPDALVFCLFRALFFFCCDDFRNTRIEDTWPSFFKAETLKKLSDLLTEGSEFNHTFLQVLEQREYLDQLVEIQKMTPEHFKAMDQGQLHAPVKIVVQKLLELTYFEVQGGPFVKACGKQAARF